MTKTIEDLFFYCSIATDVLLIFVFLYYKANSFNSDIKIIALYTLISVIINLFVNLLPIDLQYPTYSIFTFLEATTFSLFLYLNIRSKSWKLFVLINCVTFLLFLISYQLLISSGKISSPKAIDSIPIGVETILVMIFAFYYLYEQMNDIGNGFIYSRYHFWIVLGFTVYLAGSFFIYIFASQVETKVLHQYWFITNIFYILKNVLFMVGIRSYISEKKKPRLARTYSPYLN